MKKKITIATYSDPGHGWAKVPRKYLQELMIEEKISGCSYQLGDYVYLEEDCDMSTFMNACKANDVTVEMKHSSSNKSSKIRNYARFISGFKRVEWEAGKQVTLYGKRYVMGGRADIKTLICPSLGKEFRLAKTQLDEIRELDTESQTVVE